MEKGSAFFPDDLFDGRFPGRLGRRAFDHGGSIALHRVFFHLRSIFGHHDVGRHAQQFGREGDRLREIARRMGCQSPGEGFLRQVQRRVDRSAHLESADLLEVFTLEEQAAPGLRVEGRAGQHRRAVDVRGNAFSKGFPGGKVELRTLREIFVFHIRREVL